MRANIHPEYTEVTIKMTNGESFQTRSTFKGDSIQLDIDPNTHPAWTGSSALVNENASKVARFNQRFGGMKFGSAKKEDK